jgi:hypothetical protein
MPTSLIPIIARTNTIDEWRIQTNKSATDLNDLGFYTYDKTQGTLLISNTSILSITANGTPLQVANNVLFQSSLTLGNTLFLGVQSSATGNIIAGGTISVRGPGSALSVSNNSYVGVDLQVVSNIYSNNYTSNGNVTVTNNLTVSTGALRLNGTGNVAYANNGSFKSNTIYSDDTFSTNVSTANLYAAFGRIDVLDDLAFARIGILENVTGNSYYLSSNSHTSNSVSTRYLVANISGNIVNFSSNVSSINTATILNGNVVTLVSNSSSINVAAVNTSTTLVGNVVTLVSNSASINVAAVNTSTTLVGNVVTLTSNSSSINVASINTSSINVLTSYNLTSTHRITANNIITNNVEVSTINAAWVNVSSNLWMQSGSQLRIYAPSDQFESLIVDGKTTLNTAYISSNLTVEGTWTALGDIEYETSEIILNKRTPTNADAIVRNERPVGSDAVIQWVESDDQWKISKGNTYSDLFGILDASFLDSQVSNLSTSNVSTPLAVNTAHTVAQTSGRYANSGYTHANAAFNWANVVSSVANANSALFTINITSAANYANGAYAAANLAALQGGVISGGYANAAFQTANSGAIYANSAFAAANAAALSGGVISGGYANSAFRSANSASSYANGAFAAANTAATAAALAQESAAQALANVTPAFIHANAGFIFANTANVHLNVAFRHANSAFANANNAVYRTGGSDTQSINGNINVAGKIESGNIKFNGGTALLQGGNFVFNAQQNQGQGPSLNAVIEVDRGTSANSMIRYNEGIAPPSWEFSHDGVNFARMGTVSERANNITGGASNRITYQSATDTTAFIDAPPINLVRYLQWTGTAFTWSDVAAPNLTGYIQQDASGLLPTNKVARTDTGGTRTYPMNITGDAGYATTAGSATTATSATSATNATNVTSGGSVITGTSGQSTTTSVTNFGASYLYGRVRVGNSAQASVGQDNSSSPTSGAALYVEGGIFCEKDVVGDTFRGVATSAQYADLAEKYLSDKKYPTGTIMMVGGKKEVTAAKETKKHAIIGIVSEKPAYIMNSDLKNGLMIGLKGRLPIRMIGTCEKGDLITISEKAGIGISSKGNVILPFRIIALENKETEEEGLIEVVIM